MANVAIASRHSGLWTNSTWSRTARRFRPWTAIASARRRAAVDADREPASLDHAEDIGVDRCDPVERGRQRTKEDLGVVVAVVEGQPGDARRDRFGELRQQGRLAVARWRDDRDDRYVRGRLATRSTSAVRRTSVGRADGGWSFDSRRGKAGPARRSWLVSASCDNTTPARALARSGRDFATKLDPRRVRRQRFGTGAGGDGGLSARRCRAPKSAAPKLVVSTSAASSGRVGRRRRPEAAFDCAHLAEERVRVDRSDVAGVDLEVRVHRTAGRVAGVAGVPDDFALRDDARFVGVPDAFIGVEVRVVEGVPVGRVEPERVPAERVVALPHDAVADRRRSGCPAPRRRRCPGGRASWSGAGPSRR